MYLQMNAKRTAHLDGLTCYKRTAHLDGLTCY